MAAARAVLPLLLAALAATAVDGMAMQVQHGVRLAEKLGDAFDDEYPVPGLGDEDEPLGMEEDDADDEAAAAADPEAAEEKAIEKAEKEKEEKMKKKLGHDGKKKPESDADVPPPTERQPKTVPHTKEDKAKKAESEAGHKQSAKEAREAEAKTKKEAKEEAKKESAATAKAPQSAPKPEPKKDDVEKPPTKKADKEPPKPPPKAAEPKPKIDDAKFMSSKLAPASRDDQEAIDASEVQDMNNLYHSHDAASLPRTSSLPTMPNPYVQGMTSSQVAYQRSQECSPSSFVVERTSVGSKTASFRWSSLTANDVLKHILKTQPMVQFAQVPKSSFSNVDGRINHAVLGAMGGDAGEFILALNVFDQTLKSQGQAGLTQFQVANFLSDFLLSVDKPDFALQTEQAVLDRLCSRTAIKFCLPQYRLDNPPMELRAQLLELLVQPEYVGCSHIKHMLQQPAAFEVDGELVKNFLVAFYKLLWGVPVNAVAPLTLQYLQGKLKLQVLQGPHTEGAILRVKTSACAENAIPMLVPEFGGVSIAIHHDDAIKMLRVSTARFLVEEARKIGLTDWEIIDEDILIGKMEQIADTQYKQALALDQGRTPAFVMSYPGACCMGGAAVRNQYPGFPLPSTHVPTMSLPLMQMGTGLQAGNVMANGQRLPMQQRMFDRAMSPSGVMDPRMIQTMRYM